MPDKELAPADEVASPTAPEQPEHGTFIGVKFSAEQRHYLQFLSKRLGVSEGDAVRMLVEAGRTLAAFSPIAASKSEGPDVHAEAGEGQAARPKREGADIRVVWIALAFLLGVAIAVTYLLLKGTQ